MGVSEESRSDRSGKTDRAGEAITVERSEGVQTGGPLSGDARRTLVAGGNVGEGEALDTTQDANWRGKSLFSEGVRRQSVTQIRSISHRG